jgi:fermentation-respiration switch protein FrsA (DUF1100 family)
LSHNSFQKPGLGLPAFLRAYYNKTKFIQKRNFFKVGIFNRGFYFGRRGLEVRAISPLRQAGRVAVSSALVIILILAGVYLIRNKMIYFPDKGLELSVKTIGWEFEEVWLGSEGSKVNGWYLSAQPGHYTVLLLHGNGGNLEDMIGRVLSYHRLRMGVLAIDYQGFGLSQGSPTLDNAVESAKLAWDYLTVTKKLDPTQIIVHGFSLGGGVTGQLLASHKNISHPVILDSTFTSLKEAAAANNFILGKLANVLVRDAYDTQKVLKDYKASLLISFHSPKDEIVSYNLGRKLYDSYQNGRKIWVDLTGEHMDYIANQDRYEMALVKALGLTFDKPAEPQDQ